MFEVMIDLSTVQPQEAREVALTEQYGEDLLRRWLDELLFLFETEQMVFSQFRAQVKCPSAPEKTCRRVAALKEPEGEPWQLRGRALGQRYSERLARRGAVVKAVTYHRFALQPPDGPGGDWAAEMVFDV